MAKMSMSLPDDVVRLLGLPPAELARRVKELLLQIAEVKARLGVYEDTVKELMARVDRLTNELGHAAKAVLEGRQDLRSYKWFRRMAAIVVDEVDLLRDTLQKASLPEPLSLLVKALGEMHRRSINNALSYLDSLIEVVEEFEGPNAKLDRRIAGELLSATINVLTVAQLYAMTMYVLAYYVIYMLQSILGAAREFEEALKDLEERLQASLRGVEQGHEALRRLIMSSGKQGRNGE